jgi:hypothetical protein
MRVRRSIAPLVALSLSAACATLGTQTPEGQNLPTSDVGPFRKLATKEVPGIAPYVLDGLSTNPYAEPAALALGSSSTSMAVALYVDAPVYPASGKSHGGIARTRADDGVSFYGTALNLPAEPKLVLDESEPWEGGSIHSPSVLRVGAQIYLYYAAAGGIGVAVSSDGLTFQKTPTPVLTPDPAARWETTVPTEPSVAVFPDGSWHMFYAAGVSIGEATSTDGLTWARADGDPSTPELDPIFWPSPPASAQAIDAGDAPFDTGQVADPCLLPRLDPAGNVQVRVLYTGYAAPSGPGPRASAIGFAARYGDSGPLERSGSPVYAVGKHEAGPALFEWSQGSLLYVHQDSTVTPIYTEIAAAVFPVSLVLAQPTGYPSGP